MPDDAKQAAAEAAIVRARHLAVHETEAQLREQGLPDGSASAIAETAVREALAALGKFLTVTGLNAQGGAMLTNPLSGAEEVLFDSARAVWIDSVRLASCQPIEPFSDGTEPIMALELLGRRVGDEQPYAQVFVGTLDTLAALVAESHFFARRSGHDELLKHNLARRMLGEPTAE